MTDCKRERRECRNGKSAGKVKRVDGVGVESSYSMVGKAKVDGESLRGRWERKLAKMEGDGEEGKWKWKEGLRKRRGWE